MYDAQKADQAIQFIQMLKHVDGQFHGKQFELIDWQEELLRDVFGTVLQNDIRQYQYAYLELPKKNGKTELAAAIALKQIYFDGEMNGEVYGCAAEKGQASIAFDVAVGMIEQSPYLKKRTKLILSQKKLIDTQTGTFYKVLSAEAFSKHGFKPSTVIFDELHAQPNRQLWDVMTFGAGDTRLQPLWVVITTAGDDPDRKSIGWEIHSKAEKIRDNPQIDPRWYVKIYGLPEDADPWDEKNWYIANPSLGKTFSLEKVRQAAIGAMNDPMQEKLFRQLRLNQWLRNKTNAWLPLTAWDDTEIVLSFDELIGLECYGGLDLATTYDLNGLCLLFPPQKGCKKWRIWFEGWIPEDNMKERVHRDGVPYDEWVKEGFLFTTPGNVTDYAYIRNRVIELSKIVKIKELGYDQHNATQCALEMQRGGVKMIPVSQTIMTMSPAMKQLEVLFKNGEMCHGYNPLARWCYGNVNISIDGKENYMPIKNSRTERIDLFIALVNAMCRALPNIISKGAYEERGMRLLS